MSTIFGANSACAANTQLTNGYRLFDWVMRMNSFPAFWGRSISGENKLSWEEIAFLREKNCKIALIFDELTEISVSGDDGVNDALRAVEAARELGIPEHSGIALFAEIRDDWSVNHNWMMKFAETLSCNGFVPGFIGNTDSSQNFNFDRQCGHYLQATADAGGYGALFCATQPKQSGEVLAWTPFCPSDLAREDISMWRSGEISCGFATADTLYARDPSILNYMWE